MNDPSSDNAGPLLRPRFSTVAARYAMVLTWAVGLLAVMGWRFALVWYVAATATVIVRGMTARRVRFFPPALRDRINLGVATLCGFVWAAAPFLTFQNGGEYGRMVAVGLTLAGYMIVFTQKRASLIRGLIESSPYTILSIVVLSGLWGQPSFWIILGLFPILIMSLLLKVGINRMKDESLEAVNRRQAELIRELEVARDRADAANASKSSFLGVISHELRTPMNGVLGAAQLLEMTALDERQKKFVNVITSSGEGLMMLLNDILDLTKIEAGHMALNVETVPTDHLIERLAGPFAAQAEARGLRFVCETHGEMPAHLWLDPLRLGQIVHNLLSNAIKFTSSGEVRLTVTASPASGGRTTLTIAVADAGIGIAPEDVQRLFLPFSQVDASSTRRFGGTGLGLNICRRLADLMGGALTVVSQPGAGSTFTLTATFDEDHAPQQDVRAA